jgi:cell division protein FtsL
VARGAAAAAEAPQVRRSATPAPDRSRPELSLVDAAPRRLSLRVIGTVTCALVFAALFGLAIFHSFLVQSQLRLDQLERQINEEEAHQRTLRLQVAQLGAPERILAEAQARGMVQPDDRKYLAAVVPGTVVPAPNTTPPASGKGARK